MQQPIALESLMWRGKEDSSAYEEAFTALVHRHSRFVFQVAYSVLRNTADAEDAGQEAFLKLYRSRTWQNAIDERAFLARTTWRLALDRIRSSRRLQTTGAKLLTTNNFEDSNASGDLSRLLHRLIDSLPEELRHPLALSTIEELSSAEVGRILDIPEGTVRSRLSRAREILKQKAAAVLEKRS